MKVALSSTAAALACLCVLFAAASAATPAATTPLTLDLKWVKLTAAQRASLERYLAEAAPTLAFDWNSLGAHTRTVAGKRQPLSVTLNTLPALTAAGVCRSAQHHFRLEGGARGWRAVEDLTTMQAWKPAAGDCAAAATPVGVDRELSDEDFLFMHRQLPVLRKRAAPVIGGSDCARVLHCEVTLRRITRVSQEHPSRIITRLGFSPVTPGPACLYAMELSFTGPVTRLEPLGASCPLP